MAIARILLSAGGVSCIVLGWFLIFSPDSQDLYSLAPFLGNSVHYELNRYGSWAIFVLGFFELVVASFRGLRYPRLAAATAVALGSFGEILFAVGTLQVAGIVRGISNFTAVYQLQVLAVLILVTLNSALGVSFLWLFGRVNSR